MTNGAQRPTRPFEDATPGGVAGMTGLGVATPAARDVAFPVAPAEAFCPGGNLRVAGEPARAILDMGARGARRAGATIDRRLPPRAWRRGVPLPSAMVREENLFVVAWRGVTPLTDCHGDVGLLDPESLYADREGARLPGAGALTRDAAEMLQELSALMAEPSVEGRLRFRIAQLLDRCGVGTAAGIRLRLALTHVQWPLLVGADEEALVAAFRRLVRRGQLTVDGRSLVVPWEAWPAYARTGEAPEPTVTSERSTDG